MPQLCKSVQYAYGSKNFSGINMHRQCSILKLAIAVGVLQNT